MAGFWPITQRQFACWQRTARRRIGEKAAYGSQVAGWLQTMAVTSTRSVATVGLEIPERFSSNLDLSSGMQSSSSSSIDEGESFPWWTGLRLSTSWSGIEMMPIFAQVRYYCHRTKLGARASCRAKRWGHGARMAPTTFWIARILGNSRRGGTIFISLHQT